MSIELYIGACVGFGLVLRMVVEGVGAVWHQFDAAVRAV